MIPPEPRDTDRRMPKSTDPAKYLPALAREAAKKRRPPKEPMLWSEALAEAPWDKEEMPAPWGREFRKAYAAELERLGHAQGAKTVTDRKTATLKADRDRTTLLDRRTLRAMTEEFEAMDAVVADIGNVTWTTWARRVLAAAVEVHWQKK